MARQLRALGLERVRAPPRGCCARGHKTHCGFVTEKRRCRRAKLAPRRRLALRTTRFRVLPAVGSPRTGPPVRPPAPPAASADAVPPAPPAQSAVALASIR